MIDATRQSQLDELRAEWAAAVDASDPDALDDWPLERIADLAEEVEALRQFIRNDYNKYHSHHPYAHELRRLYPWLGEDEGKSV